MTRSAVGSKKRAPWRKMKGTPLDPDSFEVQEGLASASEDFGNKLALRESGHAEVYLIRAIRAAELMRKRQPDLAEPYFYLAVPCASLVVIKHGTDKGGARRQGEAVRQEGYRTQPHYAPAYAVLRSFLREVARLNWVERALASSFFGRIPRVRYQRRSHVS